MRLNTHVIWILIGSIKKMNRLLSDPLRLHCCCHSYGSYTAATLLYDCGWGQKIDLEDEYATTRDGGIWKWLVFLHYMCYLIPRLSYVNLKDIKNCRQLHKSSLLFFFLTIIPTIYPLPKKSLKDNIIIWTLW